MARNTVGCLGRVWETSTREDKRRGGGTVIWQPTGKWQWREWGQEVSPAQGKGEVGEERQEFGHDWSTWILPQTVNIDWSQYRSVQRTAENRGWHSKEERSGKGGAHFRWSLTHLKIIPQEGHLAIRGHALPIPPSTLQVLGYRARHVICLDLACVPLIWPLTQESLILK